MAKPSVSRDRWIPADSPVHALPPMPEDGSPFRLGVVIPLKSRSVARCWPEVEARLRATVRSLHRQSSPAWEAVIVGHERPDVADGGAANLTFTTIDDPSPVPGRDERMTRHAQRQDRRRKIIAGMHRLADRAITHWLHLDADDLLHGQFVTTVAGMVPFDIAMVRSGYAYYPALRRSRRLDRLDRCCGSTVLTSDRWWLDPAAPRGRRYNAIDHRRVDAYAALRGVPVHDYPGRGVAYVLGHGDNLYRSIGRRLRVWIESRFLASHDDAEFGDAFEPQHDR